MKAQRIKPKVKISEAAQRRNMFFMLKSILPRHIPLLLDGILCAIGNKIHIDLFKLEKQIPNYNGEECTYKGKPNYSMSMAIEEEWGKEANELINNLI